MPNRIFQSRIFQSLPAVIVAFAATTSPLGTVAHHASGAVYDSSTTTAIEGAFAGLELVNPHTWVRISMAADSGEAEEWTIEAPGKLSLARRGWTDTLFSPGETLTAFGHPAWSGGNAMWLVRIVKSDGTEYWDPAEEDALAIEAERRERVRRATQQ